MFCRYVVSAALVVCLASASNVRADSDAEINLPAVTPAEVERARSANPNNQVIGLVRPLDVAADDWRRLPPTSGATTSVWRLRINSPSAEALAVGFERLDPPRGAALVIFAANGDQWQRARPGRGAWRSNLAPGSGIALEWRLASGAQRPPSPDYLWHILSRSDSTAATPASSPPLVTALSDPTELVLSTCDVNDTVTTDGLTEQVAIWKRFRDVSLGSVRLIYPGGRFGILTCSGSLMDNGDGTPGSRGAYLLSAAHCFEDYHADEVSTRMSNLSVRWGVTGDCPDAPESVTFNTNADLVAWDALYDYALLHLDDALPSALNYVGWSSRTFSLDSSDTRAFHFGYPFIDESRFFITEQRYASGSFRSEHKLSLALDILNCDDDPVLCRQYWIEWELGRLLFGISGGGAFDMRPNRPPRLVGVVITYDMDLNAGSVTNFARAYHYDYRLRLALEHGEAYHQACVAESTSAVNFNCLRPTKARACQALDAAAEDCARIESVENRVPEDWRLDFEHRAQGDSSLRSGLSPDKNSCLKLRLNVVGDQLLEFSWRVSSEADSDFLEFHLDAQLQRRISGERDWRRVTARLSAGKRELSWCYVNRGNVRQGLDAGFVDAFALHSKVAFLSLDKSVLSESGDQARLRLWRFGADEAWRVRLNPSGDARSGEDYRLSVEGAGVLDQSNVLSWPAGSSSTLLVISVGDDDRRIADRYLRLSPQVVDSANAAVPIRGGNISLTISSNAPSRVFVMADVTSATAGIAAGQPGLNFPDDSGLIAPVPSSASLTFIEGGVRTYLVSILDGVLNPAPATSQTTLVFELMGAGADAYRLSASGVDGRLPETPAHLSAQGVFSSDESVIYLRIQALEDDAGDFYYSNPAPATLRVSRLSGDSIGDLPMSFPLSTMDNDRAPPRNVIISDVTAYPSDAPVGEQRQGERANLTFTEASIKNIPIVQQGDGLKFVEGELRTYAIAMISRLFEPVLAEPGTTLRFELTGAGAGAYRVSASGADGRLPMDPTASSAMGVFANNLEQGFSIIFIRILAVHDDDGDAPPLAGLRVSKVSGNALISEGQKDASLPRLHTLAATDDDLPELSVLRLEGSVALTQAAMFDPVVAAFRLTGMDQFGGAFAVDAAEVTAVATAGAAVQVMKTLSNRNLSATLLVTITPYKSEDTIVTLRAFAGEVSATATVFVDAVDRVAARLALRAVNDTLTQNTPEETVTARFMLRVIDNYGDDDVLPAATLSLSAVSSDGETPDHPAQLPVPPGGGFVAVSLRPVSDATLTLTASLAGVESALARTRIIAAAPRRLTTLLLDGERMPSQALTQARVGEPVMAMFRLSGIDQYGDAFAVDAAEVTATASAKAMISVERASAADALSATLTLTIVPNRDEDVRAVLRVAAGEVSATATVFVDAVDRVAARLALTAANDTLMQNTPEETVTARFMLRVIDNYGDDDVLPAATLSLSAVSSDGETPDYPAQLPVPPGGAEVAVSLRPVADATLTLTASLAGVESASARARIVAAAPRRLTTLLLDGERTPSRALTQARVGEPVMAAFRLSGIDQYGDAFAVDAVEVTAVTTANAMISVERASAADALSATLTLRITPNRDEDARGMLRVAAGEVSATATVFVDAVDRVAARLVLRAVNDTLTQNTPEETVTARFTARVIDNYGDDDVLPAATLSLSAVSSDGETPDHPAQLLVPPGGAEVAVSLRPVADAMLTLTASLAGVESASARTRIIAAAPRRLTTLLLDGERTPSRALTQARVGEPVMAAFRLSGMDQYGEAFAVDAVEVTAVASARAMISVERVLAADALSATLTLTIVSNRDEDARGRLRVAAGEVSATATVFVDAVDRVAARLALRAASDTLTQNVPEETVTARFILRVIDNYGDDDVLPAATLSLSAVSSDGETPDHPAQLLVSSGGAEVAVSLRPVADATLTLTASLAGVESASARTRIVAAAPRRLTTLLLDGERMPSRALTQAAMFEPVMAAFRLSGIDQYGDAFAVDAAEVTATASADAMISVERASAADALSATLTLRIVPNRDEDARGMLRVAAGEVSATATVFVDAVDRVAARLVLRAVNDTLTQNTPEETVTARFMLRVIDNYGDDDVLPAATLSLSTASSDGETPDYPAQLLVSPGGAEVAVSLRPVSDATLTLTASLAGVMSVSARTRIVAASPRRLTTLLLDGERTPSRALTQARVGEPVMAAFRLSGMDQYGEAFAVDAAEVTATASANAMISVERALAADALSATLTLTIVPNRDEDARAVLRVATGEISATASVVVDAVDRVAARLALTAVNDTLTQNTPEETVTARFMLRVIDNYGDDDVLPAATLSLSAVSSDGETPDYPAQLLVSPGGVEVAVSLRPVADATLTLTASLAGVESASARARIVAAAPRRLTALLLDGERTLTQARVGEPVMAMFRLSGIDQYGEAFAVDAVEVTAVTTAKAMISVERALAADALSATLTLTITPNRDEGARAVLRVAAGEVSATATVFVDAVDRVAARLALTAVNDTLTQNTPEETVTARFLLRVIDNYGDDDVLPAATLSLSAVSSDGQAPVFPLEFEVPSGGAEIAVSLRPVADAMLTLTASLAGVESASARARIVAAAPRRLTTLLLDGERTPSRALTQARVGEPVVAVFRLSGIDQYGEAFAVDAVEVTAVTTANAMISVERALAADALSATLTLTITPNRDEDARGVLRVTAGEVSATATVFVDAVDRVAARLALRATSDTLTQNTPEETVTARFILRVIDNYGDDDVLPAATLSLSAVSSDGETPDHPAQLPVPPGGVEVAVSLRPVSDATLTLTASLAGVMSVSARARIAAAAPRRLTTLLLDGERMPSRTLTQARVGEPVMAAFRLSGIDQYGDAFAVDAVEVTAATTAKAMISVERAPAADALSATLTLTIVPNRDEDARAVLRVAAGEISATASVVVDAVDRVAARLALRATSDTLMQNTPEETVTARFLLRVIDNYGDDDVLPAATLSLSAVSSDGETPDHPAQLPVPPGGVEVAVSLRPVSDATLTLTASLAGVESASARTRIAAAAPRRLTTLLLDGERTLTQARVGEPVMAAFRLSGIDQYGDAFAVDAAEVTATASANAMISVERAPAADALSATLTLTIVPNRDEDASAVLRVVAGEVSATASVVVDAVDRVAARLALRATSDTLTQNTPEETVTARFMLRVIDNYGDDDVLPAATLSLSAVSSDGETPDYPAQLPVPPGGAEVAVSLRPVADATLTLTASLAGVESASARTRIVAAAPRRLTTLLLDGERTLTQARVGEPVMAAFRLSGIDQYGEAFAVDAAEVTATASAKAMISVERAPAADALSATLTLTITPNRDEGARAILRVAAGEVSATASVVVDAVDRIAARLALRAVSDTLTQNTPEETVTARFLLRVIDNYGDDDVLPAATLSLSAVSSDGETPDHPAQLPVPPGGVEVAVSLRPVSDATLTLTASLAGVESASARARIVAAAPRRLTTLLLDGERALTQVRVGEPVMAAFRLSGMDQYGEAFAVDAAEVTATASANAMISVERAPAADALSATLTLRITPNRDEDARAVLRVAAGEVSATATVVVDAVDRVAARLALRAVNDTLTQNTPEETVTARFTARVIDNYGDDDVLPAATLSLSAVSSDGATPDHPAQLPAPPGGVEVAVSLRPVSDATLTLTASLTGVESASVRTRIAVAAPRRLTTLLLDGERTPSRALTQAATFEPVMVAFRLSGIDQYGDAFAVDAVEVTAVASARAMISVERVLAADALSATLTLTIVSNRDEGARAVLRVAAGEVSATATVFVDAVDRVAARLALRAANDTLTQNTPEETVTARFMLRVIDNYGDDDVLPAATLSLSAVSSDGETPDYPAQLLVPPGGGFVAVSLRPVADATLTLTASLAGVESVSARTRIVAAAPRRLTTLLLDGERTLTQARVGEPVMAAFRLSGIDQYGEAFAVDAAEVTATASAKAMISVERAPAADALSATLTLTITPNRDEGARAILRVAAGEVSATASVVVDAVDRVAARLALRAVNDTLTQNTPEETVTARFMLRVIDNYGDDDVLPAATLSLSAVSSDGETPDYPAQLLVSPGGGFVAVSLRPVADATLTLTASLAGVESASARTRIVAAAPRRLTTLLLDGERTPSRRLTQAAMFEPVVAAFRLSGIDQYGEAFAVDAVEVTAVATADAMISVERAPAADALSATLTLRITPNRDEDARAVLRVVAGEVSATATVVVDAVDRVAARLALRAVSDTLTQNAPKETVTARFILRLIDNYGDDDVLPAMAVALSVVADYGATPEVASSVAVGGGVVMVAVSAAPSGRDVIWTLTARLFGVAPASAQVAVQTPPPVLDVLRKDRRIDIEELLIALRYVSASGAPPSRLLRNLNVSSSDDLQRRLRALDDDALDVNGDNRFNAEDMRLLIRYALGMDAHLLGELNEAKAKTLLGL